MAPLALMLRAAWNGARARAPGQDLRLLVFAMMVYLVVQLWAGDEFYGSHGVILWFLGGHGARRTSTARACGRGGSAARGARPRSRPASPPERRPRVGQRVGVGRLEAVDDARPRVALLDQARGCGRPSRPAGRDRPGPRPGRGASASASPAGTRRPPPSVTRCAGPPASVATTGRAQAMASSTVIPNGSPKEGTQRTAQSADRRARRVAVEPAQEPHPGQRGVRRHPAPDLGLLRARPGHQEPRARQRAAARRANASRATRTPLRGLRLARTRTSWRSGPGAGPGAQAAASMPGADVADLRVPARRDRELRGGGRRRQQHGRRPALLRRPEESLGDDRGATGRRLGARPRAGPVGHVGPEDDGHGRRRPARATGRRRPG